jgi:hypothetical protein
MKKLDSCHVGMSGNCGAQLLKTFSRNHSSRKYKNHGAQGSTQHQFNIPTHFFLVVLLHNHDTIVLWLNPTSQLFHHLLEKFQSIKGFILTLFSLVHTYPLVSRAPMRTKLLLEASHFLGVHQFPITMKAGQINMKS